MKEKNTVTFTLDPKNPPKMTSEEKARFHRTTDEEALQAALSDPDALPFTDEELIEANRIVDIKNLRQRLDLTQKEFAEKFHLPLATVRDWEQYRVQPDRAARVLLRVIDREPEAVARALHS